ncbi:MAG: hypothetical protein LV481_11180 [Methylacidiphilales bacterium]|nr:hypothetical protein [Candidatus Methylacidiphilales bacterium]
MKIKIGTQLEEEVYKDLKVIAAREKRGIGDVIQAAVADYLHRQTQPRSNKSGLARFLESPPMNISDEGFQEILNADYYEQ